MTRKDLEHIVFQIQVSDQSVAWLRQKMSDVIQRIDIAESTQPIDYELISSLEREFRLLKNRNLIEKKINDNLYAKFNALPKQTGQYKVSA